jgi:hypothetical protein
MASLPHTAVEDPMGDGVSWRMGGVERVCSFMESSRGVEELAGSC